jgi:hypothetical protein
MRMFFKFDLYSILWGVVFALAVVGVKALVAGGACVQN